MSSSSNYIQIRCPSTRPHKSNKDNGYIDINMCGALIGALNVHDNQCDVIMHCPRCKLFWNVTSGSGGLVMKEVLGKIDLIDTTKVIE